MTFVGQVFYFLGDRQNLFRVADAGAAVFLHDEHGLVIEKIYGVTQGSFKCGVAIWRVSR
jgi:hypothetical protein